MSLITPRQAASAAVALPKYNLVLVHTLSLHSANTLAGGKPFANITLKAVRKWSGV